MPQRTRTQLLDAFANNTTGDISAADCRDLIQSIIPAFGSYWVATPQATTGLAISTYKKAAGTTAPGLTARFNHANNRLTYSGAVPIHCVLHAAVSFTTTGVNDILSVGFAKNDVVLPGAIFRAVAQGSDIGAAGLTGDIGLAPGDYLELWVSTNAAGSPSVTLDTAYVTVLGLLV